MKGVKLGGRAMSMPAGLSVGVAVSVGSTIVLSAAAAKMLVMEILSEGTIGYAVLFILFVSAFVGALTAVEKIKSRRFLVCMLSGILYMIVLLGATALLFGGEYEAVGVTGLLVLGGSAAAALLGNEQKKEGRKKKRRRLSC